MNNQGTKARSRTGNCGLRVFVTSLFISLFFPAVVPAALGATTPGWTNGAITHPPFNNGAAGGVTATPTLLTAVGKVVRQEGKWTFSYANTAAYPAGTYGGSVAKKGIVTYTATAL